MEQKEKQKLEEAKQRFYLQTLTKDQAEFSIGRNLSDNEWQVYTKSKYRKNKNLKTTFIRLSNCSRNLK